MGGVDVVIPCYQYGRFLRECTTSVLTQGVDDLRILIIDNASTDDSLEVARQLAREDRRIELVAHPTNLGATASYNEGIEWASAEYFVLLDADDLLAPGCLVRALPVMQADPEISFTYGREALVSSGGGTTQSACEITEEFGWRVIPGRQYIEQACRYPRNFVGAPTVVRRTAAQKRAGFHRPELPYSDDLEMWLRLATFGSVASTRAVQGIRRVHGRQMSLDYRTSMVRDFSEREAAFKVYFANEGRVLGDGDRLLKEARRNLAADAYWSALSHLVRGYVNQSILLFKFCLTRRPSAAIFPPVSWLFQMDRTVGRVGDVLLEAARRIWKGRHVTMKG